jgi:hypothetical protein
MTRFSLQHPNARNYLYEFAYLAHLRANGILAPRYDFVNVEINGDSLGIFAIEEHFDSTMIENQGRREGVILKWDEDPLWVWRLDSNWSADLDGFFSLHSAEYETTLPGVFRPARVGRNPDLQAQADAGMALLRGWQSGELPASEVFDIDKMANYAAISDLWNVAHAHFWHNRRYYYNPVTALLEPIGFDAEPFGLQGRRLPSVIDLGIRTDRQLATAYVSELGRVSSAESVEALRELLEQDVDSLVRILEIEFEEVTAPWPLLLERAESIRNALRPEFPVMTTRYDLDGSTYVVVSSLMDIPVEVVGFAIGEDDLLPAAPLLSSGDSEAILEIDDEILLLAPNVDASAICRNTGTCVTFKLPGGLDSGLTDDLQVVTSIVGTDLWDWSHAHEVPDPRSSALVQIPRLIDTVLSAHPYLELTENGSDVQFQQGTWVVDTDIILPDGVGLGIQGGTDVEFGVGVIVMISGPLTIIGTPQSKISLGAVAGSWGGILVSQSARPSVIKDAIFANTIGISRGGWQTTGGLTFYESDVEITDSRFENSEAEDALNVISATVSILGSVFSSVASDAVDGDFVSATIESTVFEDVGGDALDFSGSTVDVAELIFNHIGDKALSVGERSILDGRELTLIDVGIGVASKDSSTTKLDVMSVENARITAAAAYRKKPEFGPGTLAIDGFTFDSSSRISIVDLGSSVVIDGRRTDGSNLDVEALYEAGILGN